MLFLSSKEVKSYAIAKKANPEGLAFLPDSILDDNNLQRRRD